MPTLRESAQLLAASASLAGLRDVAALLGFDAPAEPVDAEARARLGLPGDIAGAEVVRGHGMQRALLVVSGATRPLREQLAAVARALAASTPHSLWMVVATAGDEVAVAAWTIERGSPRLAALLADRRRIVASDADALATLAAAREGDDLLVHARWCEILGRDALTRRFFRTLSHRVDALARSLRGVPGGDAAELALLTTSRLLFLCFLQAKGWLDGERDFLATRFDRCMAAGGGFQHHVLLPLFFGTLNTPMRRRAPLARGFGAVPFLNGGLFSRSALERRHSRARFSDEAFGELFGQLLGAYRFTAREDDSRWSEVAIDPEMLGRAFESLMGGTQRRASGTFYTPQRVVAHVAEEGLAVALSGGALPERTVREALGGTALAGGAAAELRQRLARVTVLDPACGSGAFLVFMLERLTDLHRAAGDARPVGDIRRVVLARAIHGVDVSPTAVWLCELRLWLSVVIESEERRMGAVTPLPNLDCNVRVGDALSGAGFVGHPSVAGPSRALVRMRERYARASGPRKAPLRRALAREERDRAIAAVDRELSGLAAERRERLHARRARDLFGERARPSAADLDDLRRLRRRVAVLRRERARLRDGGALPFSFPSHFGHVHAMGGFALVVGNPPWVRLHNIPVAARTGLRERFAVFGEPGWEPTFDGVAPTRGFGAQVDLAALFVERALSLAAPGAAIALLLPAKLWRSLSGGALRRLLDARSTLRRLDDWSDAPALFDAAVYPSAMVSCVGPSAGGQVVARVHRRGRSHGWQATASALRLDADPASPWLVVPPPVRAAFDRLREHGVPLGASPLGRPTLGVKCGCNDAFTVQVLAGVGDEVPVQHLGREGTVERAVLRPLLRGECLTPWTVAPSRRRILWTHAPGGAPLDALPAGAARWLTPWKRRLAARSDLHGARAWWSLFRIEGADAARPRVVWGDFGRVPRAAVLPAGASMVPLNSCYVLSCADEPDALALTALLNSPLSAAWLNMIAEPARGGWHRYLAWTVNLLPLPADWQRARAILSPLAERAVLGSPPSRDVLLDASCDAYRIAMSDVHALLDWNA